MQKKVMLGLAAIVILFCNVTMANTVTIRDHVIFSFVDFNKLQTFYVAYKSDVQNGVEISGPAFMTTHQPASVNIWNDDYDAVGNPSMNLELSAQAGSCDIKFQYGPSGNLDFAGGQAPFCRDVGLTVSNITKLGDRNYLVSITKNS